MGQSRHQDSALDGVTMHASKTIAIHPDSVYSVAISDEADVMATGCRDNQVRLWSFPAGKPEWAIPLPSAVVGVAFSPDGHWVAAATDSGTFLIDLRKPRPKAGPPLGGGAESVAFDPASGRLAVGGVDGELSTFDPLTGKLIKTMRLSRDRLLSLDYGTGGETLLVASGEGRVTLLDPASWAAKLWRLGDPDSTRLYRACMGYGGDSIAAAVSSVGLGQLGLTPNPDVHMVLNWSATDDDVVDWEDGMLGHAGWIGALAFEPHGMLLASGSADEMVKVWEPIMHELAAQSREHRGNVHSLVFSPDGRRLVSASADRTVKLWQTTHLDYEEITRDVPEMDVEWLLVSMLEASGLPGVDTLLRLSQDVADRLMTVKSDSDVAEAVRRLSAAARDTVGPIGLPIAVGTVLRLRQAQATRNGWADIAERYQQIEDISTRAFADSRA
jgi:hypothetical protein